MDEISIFDSMVEPGDENIDNDIPSLDLPFHNMSELGDLGDLALLKAVIDGDGGMADDKIQAGDKLLQDSTEPTPEFMTQIDTDFDILGDEMPQVAPAVQLEIAIPELSVEKRSEYSIVYSSVVEQITGVSDLSQDLLQFHVEFTDGRVDSVRL